MEKEIKLILALINLWWYAFHGGEKEQNNIIDFKEWLDITLDTHEVEELNIVYDPTQDKWIIKQEEER